MGPIVGSTTADFPVQQVVALAVVVGLLLAVLGLRRWAAWARKVKATGLLVGADNRLSTSKTTAALWTLVALYFIAAMALIAGFQGSDFASLVHTISPLYIVLLGGPFAAAVLAKATVSNQVSNNTLQKSAAQSPQLADVFSDDGGNTDLVDLQYLAFNLLIAIIVVAQFVHAPGYGAPSVPDFLPILTGASATTYVANKALVSGNPPSFDRIAPASCRPGDAFTAYGSNFIAQGDVNPPQAFWGTASLELANEDQQPYPSDTAEFRTPPDIPYGSAQVVLRTPAGVEVTSPVSLTIVPDELVISQANPTSVVENGIFVVYGDGFYSAIDVNANGTVQKNAQPPQVTLTDQAGGQSLDCSVQQGSTNTQLTVVTPRGALGDDKTARYFNLAVSRGSLQGINPAMIAIKICPAAPQPGAQTA